MFGVEPMQMKRAVLISITVLVFFSLPVIADDGPVAWWTFDQAEQGKVVEAVGGRSDAVIGNFKMVKGVSGSALKLDGLTSYIVRESAKAPKMSPAFTIEAWVALGAYPLNFCPIASQHDRQKSGYFFGISDKGHVGLEIFDGDATKKIATQAQLGLRKWHHIAGVFDPDKGLVVYIDGAEAARLDGAARFTQADQPLFIGRFAEKTKPTGGVRGDPHMATDIFYDGIIDELTIFNKAFSAGEVSVRYNTNKPTMAPDIPMRVLPGQAIDPGAFGAFYTRLKYYDEWDALWRVGDFPDVVVRFENAPYKFIFWRGTGYIPHWVTENNIWYDNEFTETDDKKTIGCAEPMSDKQCRNSHVRIIESNDARTVVHWRYALVDVTYKLAHIDQRTGWGDWTDEIFTIWPDGVAVRKIILHSTVIDNPRFWHEWHESIVVMGPGQTPEDVIETEAITLANFNAESHTYSWATEVPRSMSEPENACIQLVNTKSRYKPFVIVFPEPEEPMKLINPFRNCIRRDVSFFPWWNHWPTSQNPSDGRFAMAADRAAHSSLTHIRWKHYAKTENTMTKIMLNGMTDKKAADLALLARSWVMPPKLTVTSQSYQTQGYDPAQRAYVITAEKEPSTLEFTIAASREHPIANLPLVIKNWGPRQAVLTLNGQRVTGADIRKAHVDKLEGTNLVIWAKIESTNPLKLTITSPQ
jgi:hypothetical protein